MAETLVPVQNTPIAAGDLYKALRVAWASAVQDSICTRDSLLVLLAQSALETGFWHACWNWNLGNVKHVAGDGYDYYQIRCNEIIGGKVVWISPPDPGCSFRSYASISDGALSYLTLLRGRFRPAWPAVVEGDPVGFCHLLKLSHYYTADEGIYTAGVVRCYHQLDSTVGPDTLPDA
jgi:flagellum-specific peptidoglycan hydrolase FlgJ